MASSSSMIRNPELDVINGETSDSCVSNINVHQFPPCKRARHDHNSPNVVTKFKGVVSQQNGHWGAQIYANHQRIWLGTFKTEKEAAMAYDSAAIKLRRGDSHRNFPWTGYNVQEHCFQNQYSAESILNMIRDGSYQLKLSNFVKTQQRKQNSCAAFPSQTRSGPGQDEHYPCIQLFSKELTPSDVGKLNRLVIPKKFAVKYFPSISETGDEEDERALGAGVDDKELIFYDGLLKSWKFRYCYWKSSQSFVFTRGWNRFVKEKKLREGDIVTFYTCVCPDKSSQEARDFPFIDVTYSDGQSCMVDGIKHIKEMQKELELNLGQSVAHKLQKDDKESNEEMVLISMEPKDNAKENGLRIFGVRIN
ncbi:hypothetical protein Tsubulata_025815 [Turnera subulata]|uniref:Uncharacterized protein n=1 Tax=Turnera subulata TaxID=218843 RepID=A0A9Q0J2H8_9ROSI|nr:hypothetical protein Tsubulata_025815 [Turnera subulata]